MSISLQPDSSVVKTKRIFQLGTVVFSVINCDPKFEEALEQLLPHYQGPSTAPGAVTEINTGCSKQVLALIRHIANLHHNQKCVWIEGSCLISPNEHTILVAGRAQSGKSTTSMALKLGHGWRVLAENLCMIDYQNNQLLKFLSPISFDDQCLKILERSVGVQPEPTLALEFRKNRVWSPLNDEIGDAVQSPRFDLAVWLDRPDGCADEFQFAELGAGEFGRKTLTISNLLRISGAAESFNQSLASARCITLVGGELEQRLQLITTALS